MRLEKVSINKLKLNTGQIEGLPKNPRFIKNERYEALKKSIEDAPEMLELRELIVYDNKDCFVIIGGNMRFRALKELGYKEVSCKILDNNTDVKKLREYLIKDNVAFGSTDWEALSNEWDIEELQDWGQELEGIKSEDEEEDEEEEKTYTPTYRFEVSCNTENEKNKIMAELLKRGISCTDDY